MSKVNAGKLSRWTAVLLVALLIAYYVIILVHTHRVTQQVDMIGEHPYPIAIEVGDVTTRITRLDGLAERLTYVRTPEVIEGVRQDYEQIDGELTENIDFIIRQYIYRPEDALALQQTYQQLWEAQNQLLLLCADTDFSNEQARTYYEEEIHPRTEEMNRLADLMIYGSEQKFAEFQALAHSSQISTILLSTVLIVAVFIALAIYLNILRKKTAQEEQMRHNLRYALESAQSANEAKSQFLFNMSHDIRTPMNAVIGMTAIAALHADEPAKVRDCLSKITASSRHLLSLINDVLDMSKIESGKMALNEEPFILPEFLHDFLTIVEPQAKAKQLEFEVSASAIEHEHVIGDTLRLSQALLNITSNAIKFTLPGGRVDVKIRELPPQHKGYGTYEITVSDTGIGMPKEFIDKLFEPFERARTSTNSKIEGTGLGMAITKSIVDMMNGQITLSSELGKGTTFQVVLHLKLQPAEAEQFDFSVLHDLRCLVVDDDKDVCENTASMLEEIGMRSEWALSGAQAVSKAACAHRERQDYHSIILDWKMPDMDGLETTRRIRSEVGGEIPIIVLTAYDWTDIEEEAKQAGVNAFLSKPLFKSSLYHVMRDVVSGERPLQQRTAPIDPAPDLMEGRVLLVEDNMINMEIAQELIQHCGCQIETAWDGVEALRLIKSTPSGYYALIFMDIQMPNMDGYEATRQIRMLEEEEGRARTPIVAMSANAFVEDINRAHECGMDGYVTKPMGIEEIRAALHEHMQGSPA